MLATKHLCRHAQIVEPLQIFANKHSLKLQNCWFSMEHFSSSLLTVHFVFLRNAFSKIETNFYSIVGVIPLNHSKSSKRVISLFCTNTLRRVYFP